MTAELIAINIEDSRWQALAIETLAKRAFGAALLHLGLNPARCEISLLACDDARITALNSDFRDKPSATNVLSWPCHDRAQPGKHPLPPDEAHTELGDIAISYETCKHEAEAADTPFIDHVTHLLVHGLLHLLGYDHISDQDADIMQQVEVEILGKLGISDPY